MGEMPRIDSPPRTLDLSTLMQAQTCVEAAIELIRLGLGPIPISSPYSKGQSPGKNPVPGDDWGIREWDEPKLKLHWKKHPKASVGIRLGMWSVWDIEDDGPGGEGTFLELVGGEEIATAGWGAGKGKHRLFLPDAHLYGIVDKCNFERDAKFPDLGLRFGAGPGFARQLQSVIPPSLTTIRHQTKGKPDTFTVGGPRAWNGVPIVARLPDIFFENLKRRLAGPTKALQVVGTQHLDPVRRRRHGRRPSPHYLFSPAYPEAIRGGNNKNSGHGQQFAAACVLVDGFGLTYEQAWPILWDYNLSRSHPPESERGIEHKLRDAIAKNPSPSLRLLNAHRNGHASNHHPSEGFVGFVGTQNHANGGNSTRNGDQNGVRRFRRYLKPKKRGKSNPPPSTPRQGRSPACSGRFPSSTPIYSRPR